jgi:hypothetical protein
MRHKKQAQAKVDDLEADAIDATRRYDIANTSREKENISELMHTNRSDVATKVL